MSEFEDGLRAALSGAADTYSPSDTMADRIEAAVIWREHRRRRIVATGVGALALSLSLGVAGAAWMSFNDDGGGSQAQIGSALTTPPNREPRSESPDTTTSPATPPGGAAPAPSGAACQPRGSGIVNVNSGRETSFSSTDSLQARALSAASATHMVATASTGSNWASSSSGSSSVSITTGSATTSNSSTTTVDQSNGPAPSTPPSPAPPSPAPPPVEPEAPVLSGRPAPSPSAPNVAGAGTRQTLPQSGPPAAC